MLCKNSSSNKDDLPTEAIAVAPTERFWPFVNGRLWPVAALFGKPHSAIRCPS